MTETSHSYYQILLYSNIDLLTILKVEAIYPQAFIECCQKHLCQDSLTIAGHGRIPIGAQCCRRVPTAAVVIHDICFASGQYSENFAGTCLYRIIDEVLADDLMTQLGFIPLAHFQEAARKKLLTPGKW